MNKSVGEKFKALRKHIGLNQEQLSSYLDIDQTTISKCESNERQFTVEVLEKMCDLCGFTIEYFEKDEDFIPLKIAFRASSLDLMDLKAIAAINKIALNLREMNGLLGVCKNEG